MPTPTPLDMSSRPLAMEYLRRYPPLVSELTFTNLFVWRKARPVWFLESQGTLLFVVAPEPNAPERFVLGDPVGPPLPPAEVAAAIPQLRGYIRITGQTSARLQAEGLQVEPDPDNSDYVYRAEDLAGLKGEKYHKKRNLLKQCLERFDCRYEPLTPALIPECLAMQAQWCAQRNCEIDPGLDHEYQAIHELFTAYQALELLGSAIRVNGTIQAYAVGEQLAPGVAVCHFAKAMTNVIGLNQLINQRFAERALADYEFINLEQDLGLPGLRQAKASYHPHHRVEKFRALPPALAR